MKKNKVSISNPDELSKHLQHTSPITWIVLSLVSIILVAFFSWSIIYKLKVEIKGNATIENGEATLVVEKYNLKKLYVGQSVYISDEEGKIKEFNDDGQPVVTTFSLENGDYTYKIFYEKRPIEFLISK